MTAGGHDEALRELLADLPAGQERYLLHLATCPSCQQRVSTRLTEQERPSARPDYSGLWRRLEADVPDLIERAGQRHEEAQLLLSELLSHSADQQHKALREERFQSRFLLELLLEKSHAAQPLDLQRADALAGLGAHLAARLQRLKPAEEDHENSEEGALYYVRAESLAGNARRLAGRWADAENSFTRADHALAYCWDQNGELAVFCRALGLLRWEQGRLHRAEALLRHSARLFGELDIVQDQAASRVLLGLLHLECDRPDLAVRLLQAGRAVLDPGIRPWLTVRAGLSAAIGFAELRQVELASTSLEESWRVYPSVQDEREVVRISWLEGKVYARLGQRELGEQLLEAARHKLLAEYSLPEAALCSLDLAVLLAEEGRSAELRRLIGELEGTFSAELGLAVVRRLAHKLDNALRSQPENPRGLYAQTAAALRRSLRFRGYRVEGLPFA